MIDDLRYSDEMADLLDQMKNSETEELKNFYNELKDFCEDENSHKVAGNKRVIYRTEDRICRCNFVDPSVESIMLSKTSNPQESVTLKRVNKTNILTINDPIYSYYKKITFHVKKPLFGSKKVLVIDSIDLDSDQTKE